MKCTRTLGYNAIAARRLSPSAGSSSRLYYPFIGSSDSRGKGCAVAGFFDRLHSEQKRRRGVAFLRDGNGIKESTVNLKNRHVILL
jgi:hypothetical protein